jgi:hypothetical protein
LVKAAEHYSNVRDNTNSKPSDIEEAAMAIDIMTDRLEIMRRIKDGTASFKDKYDYTISGLRHAFQDISWAKVAYVGGLVALGAIIFGSVGWLMGRTNLFGLVPALGSSEAPKEVPISGYLGSKRPERKEVEVDAVVEWMDPDVLHAKMEAMLTPKAIARASPEKRKKLLAIEASYHRQKMLINLIHETAMEAEETSDMRDMYYELVREMDEECYEETEQMMWFRIDSPEGKATGSRGQHMAIADKKRADNKEKAHYEEWKRQVRRLTNEKHHWNNEYNSYFNNVEKGPDGQIDYRNADFLSALQEGIDAANDGLNDVYMQIEKAGKSAAFQSFKVGKGSKWGKRKKQNWGSKGPHESAPVEKCQHVQECCHYGCGNPVSAHDLCNTLCGNTNCTHWTGCNAQYQKQTFVTEVTQIQKAPAPQTQQVKPTSWADRARGQQQQPQQDQKKKRTRRRKEAQAPAPKSRQVTDQAPLCSDCKKRHFCCICRACQKRHCQSMTCTGQRKPDSRKQKQECATEFKNLPIEIFLDGVLKVVTPGMDNSVGSKVTWKGRPYFHCNRHQVSPGSWIEHKGQKYALPSEMDDYLQPFEEEDLVLLPWSYFNGKCPIVTTALPLMVFDHSRVTCPITFCAIDPQTKKATQTGIARPSYTVDRIYYNNDTSSGVCGSWVIASYDGKHHRIGTHAGTRGAGAAPNYSYRFIEKAVTDFQK